MSSPEGWYDDGSGRTRWWNGTAWTEYYADTYDQQVTAETSSARTEGEPPTAEPVNVDPARIDPMASRSVTVRSASDPIGFMGADSPARVPASVRPQPAREGFPAYGWGGVALIVAGGIMFLIGRGVYYSDPYYNNTTDPVGIALMLFGGVGVLAGIILTRTAFRNRG